MLLRSVVVLAVCVAVAYCDETKKVQDFADNFMKAMQDRSDVFKTTGVDADTWGNEFYKSVYRQTKAASKTRSKEIANLGRKAIKARFTQLPDDSFLVTYAKCFGEILQLLGKLDDPMALSDEYAKSFHQSIDKYYNANSPVSKVNTLVHGFVDFAGKKNLSSKKNLPIFGVLFANAIYYTS